MPTPLPCYRVGWAQCPSHRRRNVVLLPLWHLDGHEAALSQGEAGGENQQYGTTLPASADQARCESCWNRALVVSEVQQKDCTDCPRLATERSLLLLAQLGCALRDTE